MYKPDSLFVIHFENIQSYELNVHRIFHQVKSE